MYASFDVAPALAIAWVVTAYSTGLGVGMFALFIRRNK